MLSFYKGLDFILDSASIQIGVGKYFKVKYKILNSRFFLKKADGQDVPDH
jgi:hypothetical protein